MKNELGIEVCCKNCIYYFRNDIGRVLCDKGLETRCKEENLKVFRPRISKLEERIKELQEQLSNSMVILDEKEFIKTMKNRLEGKDNEQND